MARKFSPGQPRVPAGQTGGGQWTDGGGGLVKPVAAPALVPAITLIAPRLWATGLALFGALSALNAPNTQAILLARSREFTNTGATELDLVDARSLDRDEARAFCPRLEEVQERTDKAAEWVRMTGGTLTPQQFGTAVHTNLSEQIRELGDGNFRSELSYIKGIAETQSYGTKGSVRIDVLERVSSETVCIYDIKTGITELSAARMIEIVAHSVRAFGFPHRVVVTQVKPNS